MGGLWGGGGRAGGWNEVLWVWNGWVGGEIGGRVGEVDDGGVVQPGRSSTTLLWVGGWVGGWVDGWKGRGGAGGWNELLWVAGGWVVGEIGGREGSR